MKPARFWTPHPLDEPCAICGDVGGYDGPYGYPESCWLCEDRRALRAWLLVGAVSIVDQDLQAGALSRPPFSAGGLGLAVDPSGAAR